MVMCCHGDSPRIVGIPYTDQPFGYDAGDTGGLRYEGLETKLFQIATDTETGAEAKVSGDIMRVIALSMISNSVVIL